MSRVRTRRWAPALAATVALVAAGLLYASPALLAAVAVPLSYVAYGELSRVPEPQLRVERSLDPSTPAPGGRVTVTLEVTNAADRAVADLRVIDGVPEELAVVEGSPRAALALPPGGTGTLEYDLIARRGEHDFADPVVRLRSLAGSERLTVEPAAGGDRRLRPSNAVRDPPLADAPLRRAGTLPTDAGGSGLAFYATREYRAGDPMARVDWRHYAKTGEFVTVQYREERAVRTVLVVDAREPGRVTPQPGYPTGAELAGYAAERLYDALTGAGLGVSATAVGVDPVGGAGGLAWVDADEPEARARRLFEGVSEAVAGGADGASGAGQAADGGTLRDDRLLARLPPAAQVVVCSPLLDDWGVDALRQLAARDYPTVLLSPDVTGADRIGARLAALRRTRRLDAARRAGATVVSWDPDRPIDYAVRRTLPEL